MARKLHMRITPEGGLTLETIRTFLAKCEEVGIKPRTPIEVELRGWKVKAKTWDELLFAVLVPSTTPAVTPSLARRRVIKKTKSEVAAETQIADRKAAKQRGETVPGHVPPVGGKKRKKKTAKKGTRKPAEALPSTDELVGAGRRRSK